MTAITMHAYPPIITDPLSSQCKEQTLQTHKQQKKFER